MTDMDDGLNASEARSLEREVERLRADIDKLVQENVADRDRHRNIVADIEAERDKARAEVSRFSHQAVDLARQHAAAKYEADRLNTELAAAREREMRREEREGAWHEATGANNPEDYLACVQAPRLAEIERLRAEVEEAKLGDRLSEDQTSDLWHAIEAIAEGCSPEQWAKHRAKLDTNGTDAEPLESIRAELASLRAVATAARDLSDAAHECDREAEQPAPSQSSAPLVRHIKAMASLRTVLAAIPTDAEPRTAPLTEGEARCSFCGKPSADVEWLVAGPPPLHICNACVQVCVDCIDDASRGAIPPEVRAGESGSVESPCECDPSLPAHDRCSSMWVRCNAGVRAGSHTKPPVPSPDMAAVASILRGVMSPPQTPALTPDEATEIIASAPGQIAPGQQPIVRRRTGVFGEPVTLLAGLHEMAVTAEEDEP